MPLEPSALLLTDQVAVVTGAAAGLGEATALGFARCGADLALCDRDAPGLARLAMALEATGRRVHQGVIDVASPASRFVTGTTLHVDGGGRAAGGWRRAPGGFAL